GQIELDNIGLSGTPANDRRYSDERLRGVFATAKDVAQTMDELNYDVLWMAEHHFQREGYEVIPNLVQTGLWLATPTKKPNCGCTREVPYRGYTLKDITMVPRPKNLPVEIWMPIASGKTIDLMARYGLKAMITLNGEKILDDVVRAYHAACLKHGRQKQLGED